MRYIPATVLIVTMLAGAAASASFRPHRGLTEDMIITALESAHVNTAPGSTMQLLERRDGRWHDFRLDKFTIIVHGTHFTIDADTTQLN
jgi:hypothetical protein